MKQTVPFKRKKVKNVYPYVCQDKEGNVKYLFEVNKNTRYRWILKLQDKFSEEELVFFTTVIGIEHHTVAIDVINAYQLGYRGFNTFLDYNGFFTFRHFRVIETKDSNGKKDVKIIRTLEKLELQYLPEHDKPTTQKNIIKQLNQL